MASQQSQAMMAQGPPYRPTTWSLGGAPKKSVDVPITAVFLALYITAAVMHMTIFQKNRRRSHKFFFSAMLFGLCMARIATTVLRIASTCFPKDVQLAMAAQIFVAAGVVIVYIVNLAFTTRIVRAQHPHWGWHKAFSNAIKAVYVLIVITLIMLITSVVQMFYTLNTNTRRIDRDIQLYGSTFYMAVSFLPIPILITSLLIPRRSRVEKFGTGRFRTKIIVLLTASISICLGASFRTGTSFLTPVPQTQPLPDYFSKACFYVFNFCVEIVVLYLYAFLRVDRRFHIPNGAKGAGQYNPERVKEQNIDHGATGFFSEEETFDSSPLDGEASNSKEVLEDEENIKNGADSMAPSVRRPSVVHVDPMKPESAEHVVWPTTTDGKRYVVPTWI